MRDEDRSTPLKAYELGTMNDFVTPVQVWPCRHCDAWHVEIYRHDGGQLALREWHDATCRHLLALEADDADSALG